MTNREYPAPDEPKRLDDADLESARAQLRTIKQEAGEDE